MAVLTGQVQRRILKCLRLLIWVLTFANQNADKVKVTVTGRAPNDPKAKLRFGIFAHIKGDFVLAISCVAKFGILID